MALGVLCVGLRNLCKDLCTGMSIFFTVQPTPTRFVVGKKVKRVQIERVVGTFIGVMFFCDGHGSCGFKRLPRVIKSVDGCTVHKLV